MSQAFLQYVWLVPCYALLGAVLSALWFPGITRKTGPRPAGYLNAVMTFISFAHSLAALPSVWHQPAQKLFIPWLNVAGFDLTIPLELSALTVGAMALITGINFFAQIFSVGYMEMDWGWARFFSLLALFEAGMCALVLCDSLFFAYMILEVLTLATYLLIGLWFNQTLVVTGARDAFLTKRIGDLFLLMGVLALYPVAGTWNFTELAVWSKTAQVDPTLITLVGLALIAGPMGKCAQFPLHLWLDEAMEGPIPASIVRNSVVVATGAWVLVKLQPVLALSPTTMTALILIGGATAVGGLLIAIAQIDVKRTLSYPSSAYMGIVFIAVGSGQPEAALMEVFTYAVSMALLVMCIGGVIWNCITQDVRQLGGLWSRRPMSGLSFLVGTAGIVALPPFGSFWSFLKIAEGTWDNQPWVVGLLLLINALAAFSFVRVFGMIWGGKPKPMTARAPEVFWPMSLPMMIGMGFVLHVPLILQVFGLLPTWATLNVPLAAALTLSSCIGLGTGAWIYLGNTVAKPVKLPSKALQDLLSYDFYTHGLYRSSVVFGVDQISRIVDWLDRYLVDGIINLFGSVTLFSGQSLKYGNSGQSQFYMLTILMGLAFLVIYVGWPFLSHLSLILNLGSAAAGSVPPVG